MKKTLLLFAMLLGVVGAWAQEDTFVTPEAGKYYIIKGLSTTAPYLGKSNTNSAFSVVASESDAGIFYVEASNNAGKYYMTCVNATSATQFFGYNSDVRLMDQKQDITLEAATDDKYYIAVGNNWMHNNKASSIGTGKKDATTQNQWGFIEAPLNTAPEITFTNVQPNGDRLTLYVDDNNTLTFSASSPTELGAKAKFAYTVINEKYVFFNKSKNCYLIWRGNTSGGFNSNKGTLSYYNATYCDWTLTQSQQNGVTYFRMNSKRSDGTSDGTLILLTPVNQKDYRFDGYGNTVGWTTNTNGNQYSNLFTILINCTLYNEATGSTFQLTHSTPDIGVKPTITLSGIVGATLSDEVFDGGSEYSANITFPFPVSKKNGVTNPTMISSFKGDDHQEDGSFLWYADNGIVKIKKHVEASNSGRKVASEKNIISYLWALYPKCENGVFSVGIWNIGAGNYISSDKEYANGNGSTNEAEDLKLENEKVTQFNVAANNAFYHTINGKEHRLSFGSISNNSGNLGVYVKNHAGTYNSFHTPAITTQISDAKYSTICLPFAANLPEGVEAYSIETVNATYATLTSKEGLPANTGAILKADQGYYTFTQTEEEIDTWDDNLLYGSVEDIYCYGDGYVLSAPNGVAGLYKATLNKDENGGVGTTHFKNNAGKAYLPATSVPSDARFLVFSFGDDMETGITETENGNVKAENNEVYDLAGRRVQNAQKGIFIVNGKMVVR